MKKFRVLALILALVMCMSLMAACGSDGKDADAQASETQTDANASATVFKLGGIGPLTGGAAVAPETALELFTVRTLGELSVSKSP